MVLKILVIRGHHPDGFCVVSAVDKLGGIEISLEHRCGSAFWGLLWVNEVLPIQRLLDSSCLRFQLDLVVRALVSATNIIEAQALTSEVLEVIRVLLDEEVKLGLRNR